jgi:hypothetical protein
MTAQTYYLIRFNTVNPKDDYQHLLNYLSSRKGVIMQKDETNTLVGYENQEYKASITLTSAGPTSFGGGSTSLMVQCEADDNISPSLFRYAAEEEKFRVYSVEHQSFLPINPELLMASRQLAFDEKVSEALSAKGFIPIFGDKNSLFAKNQADGIIHTINTSLLDYFCNYSIEKSNTPEFSYPVASDINRFVAYYDEAVIPLNFYEKYQKTLRIFNYSHFDIEHINRKVFIQPILYEYNELKQAFEMVTSEKSALNFADKVRPGETLEESLTRIVRDDLHVAPDFIRARVAQKIDFDRDKDGVLVPRLWVCIYCKKVTLQGETQQKADRGWVPLNQTNN